MAKRKKSKNQKITSSPAPALERAPIFSKTGMRTMLIGGGTVIFGFVLLSFTDPAGQNWQSVASPAALILGYTLIGIGIVQKDPQNLP
jgi:hypothetical protein